MRKTYKPTIKVIDDFFEIPAVWRHFALKQEYTRDSKYSTWPGIRSPGLDVLNQVVFHKFASRLMAHMPGYTGFKSLQVNFSLVDSTHGRGWIHTDEPKWNIAGLIYLNPEPAPNSGTLFYDRIVDNDVNFNEPFFESINAAPEDRAKYEVNKDEQRKLFRKNMTVGNMYNRCVMFNPDVWHSADTYFGDNLHNTRLTLNFFGYAV